MSVRLVFAPKVYVVGVQGIRNEELRRFLDDIGASEWKSDAPSAADELAEIAGRCCYSSFSSPRPGGNLAYIEHLLEAGHGNPLEHAVFDFIISGISRSLSHELIRHRAGVSVSQLSQRFVDSSGVAFVVPPALEETVRAADDDTYGPISAVGRSWIGQMEDSLENYEFIAEFLAKHEFKDVADKTLRRKRAREAARSVLPNATETAVFLTANCRAIRNIIEQRGSIHADAEICRLAVEVARVVKREAPSIFQDLEIDDDSGTASTKFHKV